ncbi:MAG: methionyl-tRNA formyltransferase [Candidatus Brennerbacteria bacterium]|nr:methionyl-tRNA formyltransferase [Candidatus Brennerbacteria bacterium]
MSSYFRKSKFVFFGSPEFATIVLEKLIGAGFIPAVVVCNPDRPVGRKKIITPPPTKILARKNNVKIYQPEKLEIGNADFGIVASYAKIIPKDIIETFKLGVIGVHPSLLPRHRGASPIQSAILSGDEVTGVTLYLLDEKMDHGPILASREFSISNFQFSILQTKLAELAGDMLVKILPQFLKGEIKPQPQNELKATYTKKFKTEDAFVDLEKDYPVVVERKVRALNPEPGVWTMQNGKRVKILEAEINPAAAGGKLKLKKIQLEGKRPQSV